MTKWVYTFGDGAAEGHAGDREPAWRQGRQPCGDVPPRPAGAARLHHHDRRCATGTMPTARRYPAALAADVEAALDQIGTLTGRRFGDPEKLLLVSVRSGARASMPGMMDTVLNLGLNDETVEALADDSGDARFAYDSYRRFIQMYSDVVHGARPRGLRGDPRGGKGASRPRTRHRPHPPANGRRLSRSTRPKSRKNSGSRFRRTRRSSSGARSARCFRAG